MFLLRLNDMRSSSVETLDDVAVGETIEALQRWLDSHKAPEPYTDANDDPDAGCVVSDPFASSGARYRSKSWYKVFAKGSPLEWYNPPSDRFNIVRVPTREDLGRLAYELFAETEVRLAPLPRVS